MISASFERRGQGGKKPVPVMRNGRCFSVHQPRSAHDFTAIRFGDALMSQANTQNWDPCAKRQNDVFTDPRLARCARAWRNANMLRRQCLNFLQRNRVISPNDKFTAKLAEILREIVSKRVVIIDQQQHVWSVK